MNKLTRSPIRDPAKLPTALDGSVILPFDGRLLLTTGDFLLLEGSTDKLLGEG